MRLHINAGGLDGFFNGVCSFLSGEVNEANSNNLINSFSNIVNKTNDLCGGVGALSIGLGYVQTRKEAEESRKIAIDNVKSKTESFIQKALSVDAAVAIMVNSSQEEFYQTNPWLRPTTQTSAWDKIWDRIWDTAGDTFSMCWNGIKEFYSSNTGKKIFDGMLDREIESIGYHYNIFKPILMNYKKNDVRSLGRKDSNLLRSVELSTEDEFMNNLEEQFGFDEKSTEIMWKVYEAIKLKYPKKTQTELDWYFNRAISQLCYNKGSSLAGQWRAGAGYVYGYGKEKEKKYFVETLGILEAEYNYLRGMVILQHEMTSNPDFHNVNSVRIYLDEYKNAYTTWCSNMEKIIGVEITSLDEYMKYYQKYHEQFSGKGDYAHMMYTVSACLVDDDAKGIDNNYPNPPIDWVKGNFWKNDETRESFTGWLGDATWPGSDNSGISFGNDDYISDLDAENIVQIMEKGKKSFPEAYNNYYSELETGATRADIFLENYKYEDVESEILKRAGVKSLEDLEKKDKWYDSYQFLWNLKQGNHELLSPDIEN